VSTGKKIWSTTWRVAVGAALLLWIFHSIFVNEARTQSQRLSALREKQADQALSALEQRELDEIPVRVDWAAWQTLPRTEQWRLGWEHGPPALWKTLRSIDAGMFALSILLMGATIVLGIIRWRMVLRVQGLELPLGRAAEISLVAHFFNSFLLGTAGGDVMKAYYAARETHHKKTEAVLTVLVDRVIGLWSMLLFATAMMGLNHGLFRGPGIRTVAGAVLAMTAAATLFVFLAFRGGVSRAWSGARRFLRKLPKGPWLEHTLDACRSFGRDAGFVTRTVAVSMVLNVACVLQFMAVAQGLHLVIPPIAMFLVVPMIVAISALPIAPSGLGVRENLFVHMLALPGIAVMATPALSLSLLAFAGSLFWSIVGGAVYMMFKHKHHLAEQELSAEQT